MPKKGLTAKMAAQRSAGQYLIKSSRDLPTGSRSLVKQDRKAGRLQIKAAQRGVSLSREQAAKAMHKGAKLPRFTKLPGIVGLAGIIGQVETFRKNMQSRRLRSLTLTDGKPIAGKQI